MKRLFNRQKILVKIQQKFPQASENDLQRLAFLFSEQQDKKAYHFVHGPDGYTSLQLKEDLKRLPQIQQNFSLSHQDEKILRELRDEEPRQPPKIQAETDVPLVVTVGYEDRSIEDFINLLLQNRVEVLIDVRKNAYSRKFGFSKFQLQDFLERYQIDYLHLPDLGIESSLRNKDLSKEELFKIYRDDLKQKAKAKELSLVKDYIGRRRLALMCFERDPKDCHRHCLVDALNLTEEVRHL